jgi:hypothetical protein
MQRISEYVIKINSKFKTYTISKYTYVKGMEM